MYIQTDINMAYLTWCNINTGENLNEYQYTNRY